MSRLLSLIEAKEIILGGGIVGVPTETVYGLAANALDEEATSRIFRVKKRPVYNPLICHLFASEDLYPYAEVEANLQSLFSFWPGPLTLLLRHKRNIPEIIYAGLEYAAFRVPAHPLFRELLQICNVPMAAPSANLSGQRSPTTATMVLEEFGDSIDGVLDGGPCQIGLESTIVRLKKKEELEILRLGALSYERLCESSFSVTIGEKEVGKRPLAPGTLNRHYAPALPLLLILLEEWKEISVLSEAFSSYGANFETSCYFAFGKEEMNSCFPHSFNFSPSGDLSEAAHNFFYFLDQSAKKSDLKLLIAHLFPEEGLGRALNDRLKRAASIFVQ